MDDDKKIYSAAKRYMPERCLIKIDGPIYYMGNPFWVVMYWKRKFLKSFLRGVIVLDQRGRIVEDKEIFSSVSIVCFVPYPSKSHIEGFRRELQEFKYVYDFFVKTPNLIGKVNVNFLNKKFKELGDLQTVELINNIRAQSLDIARALENIIKLKEKLLYIMKKLVEKKDALLTKEFYNSVIMEERPLLRELSLLINERITLVRKLRKTCEQHINKIVQNSKDKKLLINYLKDEVVALFRFNSYIRNRLKLYETVSTRFEETKKRVNNLRLDEP